MNKQQVIKALKLAIYCCAILTVLEIIFLIPGVTEFFTSWLDGVHGWSAYLILFVLMFLQGTILNIPGVTILELCVLAGMKTLTPLFIAIEVAGCFAACIVAYLAGLKFGTKAVKWIAGDEEEFNKWCKVINGKTKWYYFGTVLLPLFPDDILSIVAGSLKMDFKFYCFANFVGKTIGSITAVAALNLVGHLSGNFPTMLVVWSVCFVVSLITFIILKHKK